MNILSDEQYQLLAFVFACNGSSYNPTAEEVLLWRENPHPREAEYRTVEVRPIGAGLAGSLGEPGSFIRLAGLDAATGSLSRMAEAVMGQQNRRLQETLRGLASRSLGVSGPGFDTPRTRRELVKAAETVIAHLIRLTWLETVTISGRSGLRLTELGRALLRDHEKDTVTQPDVSVVVLESNDPLAYPLLVGQLAEAGEGMLVDPYLKLDSLHRIVTSTRLTRLLVTSKRNDVEIAAMRTYLDSASLARQIEVRSSTELHDRYLLAEDGAVLTLGTSLNGVGRTTTVLMPMPSEAREVMRGTYERIWDDATLVGPQVDEDEDDEDMRDSDPQEYEDEDEEDVTDSDSDEDDENENDDEGGPIDSDLPVSAE